MADAVNRRLRASGLQGRTVTVKLRYGDFTTITRSHSLRRPVASSAELVKTAEALLSGTEVHSGVRLLGVSVSAARADLDAVVDAIRERYGTVSVGPAALVGGSGLRVKQLGDSQWGPSE